LKNVVGFQNMIDQHAIKNIGQTFRLQ